jgi:hypothetical protein
MLEPHELEPIDRTGEPLHPLLEAVGLQVRHREIVRPQLRREVPHRTHQQGELLGVVAVPPADRLGLDQKHLLHIQLEHRR